MQTSPVTYDQLRQSVIAVPPLCRDAGMKICATENQKLVDHITSGGIKSLLYGGNANLYHVRLSEYGLLLETLQQICADDVLVVPSVGPAYGLMMDQAALIRETSYPTAMVLPQPDVMTESGLLTGFRHFVETIGRPAVLYIKRDGYLSAAAAAKLANDGLVSFIKYAVVRGDTTNDPYLEELVNTVNPQLIVSGIGEQPAIVHLQQFGMTGFTSGCVCIAPNLSQQMLAAIYDGRITDAESIRSTFQRLEDLRNGVNPIRVLHEAVRLAGIADTGPPLPLLSGVTDEQSALIATAASELLQTELASRSAL